MSKGLPYEVEFGEKGQTPPSFVSAIDDGKIILSGSAEKILQLGLGKEILFHDKGKLENNSQLVELMLKLNNNGFVFSCNPKSMLSPSSHMEILQNKNILEKSFKEISWRNQQQWHLTTYEFE